MQKNPDAEPIFLSQYSSLKELKGICVAFSPDGLFLASGSDDGKVRLWDLQQPKANPIVLEGSTKPIITLAFSPDGEWIAAGSTDNTIRIWIAKTEIIANMVCEKVWRNLTYQEWKEFVSKTIDYECTCDKLPKGEGVPASGQIDISSNEFEYQPQAAKLLPKQRKLFDAIKTANTQKANVSEEEIAQQLKKTNLDAVESMTLGHLVRAGFVTKIDDDLQNIRYSITVHE